MLYGYKSTVGIALGTLKLSANICRHNKCRRSLTEPTTQVSAKVCTVLHYSAFGSIQVKRKKTQNILPLSPTHAAQTRATCECARRRRLPRTPTLAASHTEPRYRRPPAQRRRPPEP